MNSKVAILIVLVAVFIARGSYANPNKNEFLRYIQARGGDEEEPLHCFEKGHWCDSYGADYCCDCCDLNNTCVDCKPGCIRSGQGECYSGEKCCSGHCSRVLRSDPKTYCVYRGYSGLGR
uniref:Venom peptide U19-SYTX-Sth1f n=1 Tax=Scytodes thoracica TaxID=1112478 RepID=A0A0A0V676_SCYTH|nr:venom peptide U19-SYTX-Sth1f [Scytodes thoracica]